MKKISLIMLLILCFSLFSGCTKTTDKDTLENTQVNQQNEKENLEESTPEFGGELKLLMRDPSTLNPLLNTDRTVDQILKLVFDSLFELDDKEKPVTNIVDSYELSDSGTTVTITLKQNVLFHDGEELHSDDVIYSIDTLKAAPDDAIYKVNVKNYKRASAIDQYTLKIYFDQPFAFSLYTMNFPIIPKHHYKSNDDNSMKPIGTGAYAFSNFTTMKELNLIANKDWFNGKVYVENIKGIITRDKNNDSDAFNQNIVDIINPTKFDWQEYAETEGVSLTEYPTYYYTFLGFNFNNTLLSDKNIRKSIAYAIDRADIIKNEFLNHAYITEFPIHPKSWLNDNDSITYDKDINKSKELITAAGFVDADSAVDKLNLRLLVNSENPLRLRIANKIKESLESVGFVISLDLVDNGTYNQKIVSKDFDLLLGEWKLSEVPDFTFAFHSSQIEEGSNFVSYNNPELDKVLETVFGSINDDDILNATNEFKNIFAEELPYFSLFFRTSAIITKDRVNGRLNPSVYNNYNGIENVFISK